MKRNNACVANALKIMDQRCTGEDHRFDRSVLQIRQMSARVAPANNSQSFQA